MKVNEAARELGLPQGTIKTRLMRGREALRKLLVRRHPEHFGG
jgi:DNA-directed RNA polymerase specialized sigma24 family protein